MEELLDVIENPKKREAFVKDLKGLIEARKALDAKGERDSAGGQEGTQLLIVRWAFERFEKASKGIKNVAMTVDKVLAQTPETARKLVAFLEQPENRARLMTLLIDGAVAVIIALLSGLLLTRLVKSSFDKMKSLGSKVGWGAIFIILKGVPYLILGLAFMALLEWWPSFSWGRTIGLLFCGLLFFYRILMAILQVLLSPDDSRLRILGISDENAHYLWIWMQRFAVYTFFYLMVTRTFLWTHLAQGVFVQIRGLLLIPFPVMITVFIFQIAREMNTAAQGPTEEEDDIIPAPKWMGKRLTDALIHHWPVFAAGYTWAMFLSLTFHYEKGFDYLLRATLGTAVTVLITVVCLRGLDRISRYFFRINQRVTQRFPGMEEKANRYMRIVRKGVTVVLVGIALGVIGEIWGIPVTHFVASDSGAAIILRTLAIIITLAVVVSILEFSNALSAYLLTEDSGKRKEISQKQKTMIPVIRTAVNISAGFVGGIIVLDRLGVNTTPILAGAGIVGLAVGFGSQTLVKDLINGLFILFEESIRVGDWATVGNQAGMVESVGLRTVKLRDMDGTVHVIPNSTIDSVSNYSKVYSRTVMDIGIAYQEDVDEVMELLKKLGEDLQKDPEYGPSILEPLEILGLERFDDSAVIIRARFTTRPLKQWGVKREFYRRMKRVFDEQGIEIPFPHQTLCMAQPKKSKAPPLNIVIENRAQKEGPLSVGASEPNGEGA